MGEAGGGGVSLCTAATLLAGVFFKVLAISLRFGLQMTFPQAGRICAKISGRADWHEPTSILRFPGKIIRRVFHVFWKRGISVSVRLS